MGLVNKTNDELHEQTNDIDLNDNKKKKDGGDDDDKKWRGKVEWKVRGEWSAAQVWEMAGDFCGMKGWVPTLDKCERAAGEENTPGCIRYMEAGGKRADGRPVRWVLEQLLHWADQRYTYKMLDSGYGLTGYVATLELLVDDDGHGHGHGHDHGYGGHGHGQDHGYDGHGQGHGQGHGHGHGEGHGHDSRLTIMVKA